LSVATVLAVFLIAEPALWLAGVEPLIRREDPSQGFSGLMTVFQRDGERYRTRPSLRPSTFNDQSFLAHKPSNGLRIFCLGGSSAFGFPWDARASFCGVLADVLHAAYPERTVEVVNVAGISYAMHRLNIVADEMVAYDPDFFIIYSGHNEFIERDFYEALKQRGAVRAGLVHLLAHTRLFSALRDLRGERHGTADTSGARFGMTVRRDQTRSYSMAEKERVIADYHEGLDRLVTLAQRHGAKVVVATLPCNLRDWRPQASSAAAAEGADHGTRLRALATARQNLAAQRFDDALGELTRAAAEAPIHAETQFLLGRAHEGLANWDEARRAYRRACDYDAAPVRRLQGINDAVRTVAQARGALLVDVERVFEETSPHGLVGFNLIEDYVHPTLQGHQLIAWHLWDNMARAGWLGPRAAASDVFDRVTAARPGVTNEANPVWLFNQGAILENAGHISQAIVKYRQALAVAPGYVGALENLAILLARQDDAGETDAVVGRLLQIDRDNANGRMLRGDLLRQQARLAEATVEYRRAIATSPDLSRAYNQLAATLIMMNDLTEAESELNRALGRTPDDVDAHVLLGQVFMRRGAWPQAVEEFQRALGFDPYSVPALISLGEAYLQRKMYREALERYAEVLRIDPRQPAAHSRVEQLRTLLGTSG